METNRLFLRLRTSHLLGSLVHESPQQQLAFFGLENNDQLEIEWERIRKRRANKRAEVRMWDLIEKKTEAVIGNCGYHTWHVEHERAEIGYLLYENFRRKGYMVEAMEKVIAYGFNEMKLNRIEAFISPENAPSIALIQRLNFVQEGVLRAHYKVGDMIYDSAAFGLLRSDYASL